MTQTAQPNHVLTLERELPYPPQKVWRALTEGRLIDQWLMANDFLPIVGHRFQFRSTPVHNWDGVIDAEVLLVAPETRLAYSWSSLGLATVVTWTLTPTDSGTRLRMEQTGFPSQEGANYKGAQYGWSRFLSGLEALLERLD